MSSVLDSAAVFTARLLGVQVPQAIVDRLVAAGIDTLARLAFSSSSQPGSGDDQDLQTVLAAALNPDRLTPGLLASLRRVWFEAHAALVADVRQRVDRTDEAAPKRVPVQERAERQRAQSTRLAGLELHARWADWHRRPFTADSPSHVSVWRKPER